MCEKKKCVGENVREKKNSVPNPPPKRRFYTPDFTTFPKRKPMLYFEGRLRPLERPISTQKKVMLMF